MVMVQNTYGTKLFLVKVRNGKLWYEIVMVQNTYGTKWLWCKIRYTDRKSQDKMSQIIILIHIGQKVTGQKVTNFNFKYRTQSQFACMFMTFLFSH